MINIVLIINIILILMYRYSQYRLKSPYGCMVNAICILILNFELSMYYLSNEQYMLSIMFMISVLTWVKTVTISIVLLLSLIKEYILIYMDKIFTVLIEYMDKLLK